MRGPVLFLCAALALFGCAAQPVVQQRGGTDEGWSFVQPYHYPLAGIGGGTISGSVQVAERGEAQMASAALVQALQTMRLSVVQPKLDLDGVIPPRMPWVTDIAPVTSEWISAYNKANPDLPLGPAQYGVTYQGEHDTAGNKFRFRISARLHERGALSRWSPLSDDRYAGNFFVERLVDGLKARLTGERAARP